MRNQLKQKNLLVYVEFIDSFFTRDENRDFAKKMKDLGADKVSSVPIHNWPGFIKFNKKKKKHKKKKIYPCFIPWVNLTVLWDGKVVGCCDDFEGVYTVGDLDNDPSMEKIWNSSKMMQLRTHHIKKTASTLSPCAECDRLTKFPFSYNILRQGAWFLLENL